ncbi:MAG: hypothetical protein ACLS4Z_04400 [Christensenellaceae bacterium]
MVGIGVNVNNSRPEELKNTAISMSEAAGICLTARRENTLIAETGKAFDMGNTDEEWVLNRTVTLVEREARIVRAGGDERAG